MSSPACTTSPWAASGHRQNEGSQSSRSQAHSASQFLSLDAGNGQNSSPASPPYADHWKQLQAQHPSFHLEIRRNGLAAASFPSTNSRSKVPKTISNTLLQTSDQANKTFTQTSEEQTSPRPLLFPAHPLFPGRVNIHREHSGEGDKADAAEPMTMTTSACAPAPCSPQQHQQLQLNTAVQAQNSTCRAGKPLGECFRFWGCKRSEFPLKRQHHARNSCFAASSTQPLIPKPSHHCAHCFRAYPLAMDKLFPEKSNPY